MILKVFSYLSDSIILIILNWKNKPTMLMDTQSVTSAEFEHSVVRTEHLLRENSFY